MKTNRIVAAIAAGSLLLGSGGVFAQAEEAQQRQQQYQNAREQGYWHPNDPSNPRPGHATPVQQPNDRNYHRGDPRNDAGYNQRNDARYDQRNDARYDQRNDARYDPRYYQRWDSNQRRYVPSERAGSDWHGRGAGPNHDWYRGSRLPPEYNSRHYVVDDWRGHHLSAPPRGYHWVQAGGDYVLAAIATGVIASILLNQ